jgi:predicted YcjX-like family ATPase
LLLLFNLAMLFGRKLMKKKLFHYQIRRLIYLFENADHLATDRFQHLIHVFRRGFRISNTHAITRSSKMLQIFLRLKVF